MKKNIYIFCYMIFINALPSIDKSQLAKFKEDAKKFSESIDLSKAKSGKKTKDDLVVSKKVLSLSKTKDDIELSSNNKTADKEKSKPSFFSSFFGSKSKDKTKSNKKEDKEKKSKDLKEVYEDPFGALDGNLFDSVGKTKFKSDQKQANTDKKKATKKAAEEKIEAKKKEGGLFSSLGSKIKSGMSVLAKSDLAKEVGGVLKNSAVSVASNAVATGTEKLNKEVSSLNNKISGNDKKDVSTIIAEEPVLEEPNTKKVTISSESNNENPFMEEENIVVEDVYKSDQKEAKEAEAFSAKLDHIGVTNSPSVITSSGGQSNKSNKSKNKKRKTKARKKK